MITDKLDISDDSFDDKSAGNLKISHSGGSSIYSLGNSSGYGEDFASYQKRLEKEELEEE